MTKKRNVSFYERINEKIIKDSVTFPSEAFSDSTGIRRENFFKIMFRPNNYRRQIKVKYYRENFQRKLTPSIKHFQWKISSKKIFYITNYRDRINIELGKTMLSAYYSQYEQNGVKEIYLIERETQKEIDQRVKEIGIEIKKKLDLALRDFIREFNLIIDGGFFKPIWRGYEDFIQEESYLSKLPKEMVIHDTLFKKEYKEGVECIKYKERDATESARTIIHNLAVKRVTPEIVEELQKINQKIEGSKESSLDVCRKIVDIKDSVKEMLEDNNFKDNVRKLSSIEKDVLSEYIFERFKV